MPITRAANNAAGQVLADEKKKAENLDKLASSCGEVIGYFGTHLFNGWMLMFAVALLGLPLGYWPCVLIAFTASLLVGTGSYSGIKTAFKEKLK